MTAPERRRTDSAEPVPPRSAAETKPVSPGIRTLAALRQRAVEHPDEFWREVAGELYFSERTGPAFAPTPEPPYGTWFKGWKTNLSYNCLDRWVATDRRDRVALRWEGEPGDCRSLTYAELLHEVDRCAAMLRRLGVGLGDRVTIYLPMIPEALVTMLAVLRLGAVHSVVFGGFTAQALSERIQDSESKLLVTADGGWRRGRVVELKKIADEALLHCPGVETVVVVRRTARAVEMVRGRDHWYHEEVEVPAAPVPAVMVDGTHPSFILFTSGTTGRPKGAVHSTAGYMAWLYYSTGAVFGLQDRDLFWCTADIGWVTGHSYVAYGPALRGGSVLLYEGAPDHPAPDRWWELVERYGVSILYTSPTAIRTFLKMGEEWPRRHDLSSLRLLGSVGEPINPAAWQWYHRVIGGGRCPIVDTWWQTETGGILISPQPGIASIPLKPASATFPLAGIDAVVVDEHGRELPPNEKGFLVIRRPWPAEFMTLWGDEARFREVYFTRFPGWYYTADFCLRDADGYFWLLGRADEVMKVSGHRISTTELEHVLVTHPAVAESAVIGRSDAIKGEVPVAFIILRSGFASSTELREELREHVRRSYGSIGVPSELYFVEKVPKTRSAKIMRRLIRDVVEDRPLGDTTTLEDETSVEEARRAYAELRSQIRASRR